MSARTVSEELRSRRGWTETGESMQRGYGLGEELRGVASKAPRLAIPTTTKASMTQDECPSRFKL